MKLYDCSACGARFERKGRSTRCPRCAPYGWPPTKPMSNDWSAIRARKLDADPYCENPYALHRDRRKAVTVDHVLARAFGGTDRSDNLRSLCRTCADYKDHRDREFGKHPFA